jgi:hypothetical protein
MTERQYSLSSNPIPEGPRKFETKRIVVMPHALQLLSEDEINEALERHFRCDWGDPEEMLAEDSVRMNAAFAAGNQVVSAFDAPRPGPCPFYLVTNAERTETRVAMEWDDTPEEQERTRLLLMDLECLLKRHGLTIRRDACSLSDSSSGGWSFEGIGFGYVLALSEVVDWLNAAEPESAAESAGQQPFLFG